MSDTSKSIAMSFSPSFHRAIQEQADFEAGMLRLAALLPQSLAVVAESFRQWAGPNPLPWRVALDYCIDRARAGKSLPWEVSDGGWKGHHASQVIIDEANEFFQIVGNDTQLISDPPELAITIDEFTEEFRDVMQRAVDNAKETERPACPECSGRLVSLAPASRGAILVQCDDCCNKFEVTYNPTTETFTVTRFR